MKSAANRRYVVVLDDDPLVSRIIEKSLDLKSVHFDSGKTLLAEAWRYHPVAAFIDIHLGVDDCGLDVMPSLRATWRYCPLLVITSDPTDDAVGRAMDAGADDFLQKPIRPKELVARLQTRLGDLAAKQAKNVVSYGDIALDIMNRQVRGPLGTRFLSPTEVKLLICLLSSKGTIVPKQRLKRQGWRDIAVSENALDRKIFELRRALRDVTESVTLKAVYGAGLTLLTKTADGREELDAPAEEPHQLQPAAAEPEEEETVMEEAPRKAG